MQKLYQRTRLQPPIHFPATFPSWKPVRALDHILCSDGIATETPRALVAGRSDHLAVAVDLSLPSDE
jgi:endonuclease/exonuclease/phosphatase family metal-dependent hydrolase